jgi:hypothetical protein
MKKGGKEENNKKKERNLRQNWKLKAEEWQEIGGSKWEKNKLKYLAEN